MSLRSGTIAVVLAVAAFATGCKNKGLTFESVNPPSGRLGGGEEVRIRGSGFAKLGNLEVRIGGRPATNVGIESDNTIVLTTPEGRESDLNRALDISILTSEGRSVILRNAFTYHPGPSRQGASGPNEELRRRL